MTSSAGKQAGQQFGNYRLLHLLAQDPTASVYLGEHIFLKTQAAIKVVQAGLTNEELERFLAEIRVMARLRHPHIIRVLEFGVQAGQPFLVMDYTSTNSLRQLHPKGSFLPPTTILDYVRQIAPALQYAHDEGLLHLNLRPETILLGPHKQLLLSYSSTGVLDQSTIPTHPLPAPDQGEAEIVDYRAPEQLQSKPCSASDQYALAAMVSEWLSDWCPSSTPTGATRDQQFFARRYFKFQSHLRTPSGTMGDLTQPLRESASLIPPAIEQVVLKALSKAPEHRFTTVSGFAHALEEVLQPTIEPIQQVPKRPGQRPIRKRSVPMIVALVTLAAVVVVGSILLSSRVLFSSSGPSLQVAATSTAQAALATANARFAGLKPQDIYLRVTSAHPFINDPLRQQVGSTWKDEQFATGTCTFARGAYHLVPYADQDMVCLSGSSNLSNFAFQVQMTIMNKGIGGFGGICFRVGRASTTYYDFQLDTIGTYEFDVVNTNSYSLARGYSPIIKPVLNKPYLMTVIIVGSRFYFYLNKQYITDMTDSSNTLTSGQIGLMAGSNVSSATEVVFRNAEVWKL